MKKGCFVTFEGPEGSGKSTQIRLVKEFLEESGYSVVQTREPGGTLISEQIRKILLSPENTAMAPVTELLLYAAARTQHLKEVIIPALGQGRIVLCDRFHDSTTAYQGHARGLDLDLINSVHEIALDGVKPDLTIVLLVDIETGIMRAKKESARDNMSEGDRMEKESIEFHRRVESGYLEISRKEPERVRIVSPGDIEETAETVKKLFCEFLEGRK